jgi:DNA-binding transcriptional LysR family regulator
VPQKPLESEASSTFFVLLRMKIQTFQTLQMVIATGTMAKAAQSLGLTPSAVSMQVKHLEEYMGSPLFERSAQGIKPNALAQELSGIMDSCWQKVEALRQTRDLQIKGVVRMGVVDTLLPLFLPRTLAQIETLHPQLQVKASRGKSRWLQQQVRVGDLDLAILAQPKELPTTRSLQWHVLMQRQFVLIAPLYSKGTAAELLKKYRVIAYDRQTTTGRIASDYLETFYGVSKPDLEFDSIPSIVSMVSLGMGVSLLQIADTRLLQTDPVRCIGLGRKAPLIQYAALVRQDVAEKRTVQALLQVVQQVAVLTEAVRDGS